ncbi:MAG TPA: hypothetical protein PKJ41_02115 [Bryobacteraceae bacterium]|nr:hypothetical protein [Bryobacteraceae bacterium]
MKTGPDCGDRERRERVSGPFFEGADPDTHLLSYSFAGEGAGRGPGGPPYWLRSRAAESRIGGRIFDSAGSPKLSSMTRLTAATPGVILISS